MKLFYSLCLLLITFSLQAQIADTHSLKILPPPPPPFPPIEIPRIFKRLTKMPRFYNEACESLTSGNKKKRDCATKKMLAYIYENLEYPIEAKTDSLARTVVIRFLVKENGFLEDIEVVRSMGRNYDAEAKKVVVSMSELPNRWIPGYSGDEPVDSKYTLAVKFKLKQ